MKNQEISKDKLIRELQQSEEKMRTIMDSTTIGIFGIKAESPMDINLPLQDQLEHFSKGIYIECNDAYASMLNLRKQDIIHARLSDVILESEEIRDFMVDFVRDGYRIDAKITHEFLHTGEERYFSNSIAGKIVDDKLLEVWGTQTDVTQLVLSEKALHNHEKKLQAVFEAIGDGLTVLNLDGQITEINLNALKMFRSENKDEFLGRRPTEFVLEGDIEKIRNSIGLLISGKKSPPIVTQSRRKDGSIFPTETTASLLIGGEGKAEGIVALTRDISERELIERKLRESERKFRRLFSAISDAFIAFYFPPDSPRKSYKIFEVNDVACNILGYSRKELLEKSIGALEVEPGSLYGPEVLALLKNGEDVLFEQYNRSKDGKTIPVEIHAQVFQFEGKRAIMSLVRDVSLRKRVEEQLQESEEKFRTLSEQSLMGIFILQDGKLIYVNDAMAQILEESIENIMNWGWEVIGRLIYEEDKAFVLEQGRKKQTGQKDIITNYEFRLECKSGIKWVEIYSRSIMYDGKPADFGTLINISKRKSAEKQLRSALNEKEILLKEIHHRVKNNLQVIISLIGMQAAMTNEEETRLMLLGLQERARVMSRVHEQLYQSDDLARIDFKTFLEDLVNYLYQAYRDKQMLEIELESKDLLLGVDKAVPCGLIVNELVTNAFKYAFPATNTENKKLAVRFSLQDHFFILEIEDNGVGLPANFDADKPGTLGLKLVKVWAEHQLGANFQMESPDGGGLRFRIQIPNET